MSMSMIMATVQQMISAGTFRADQVVALLHFNGSENGTSFPDATGLNTWTRSGVVTTQAQKMFGTASGEFNNNVSARYLTAPSHSRFDLLGGAFSVAFFARPEFSFTGTRRVVQIGGGDSWGNASGSTVLAVGFTNNAPNPGYAPYLGLSNATASPVMHNSGQNLSTAQWDAWCWAVTPTAAKLYRNGAQVYSGAHSGLTNPSGAPFQCRIGNGLAASPAASTGFRGQLDELVIIKGWAGDVSGMTSEIVL